MQQILSIQDETTADGLSRIYRFLCNVQELNGKAYIVGRVYNPQGVEFAVLFEYDMANDEYKYVLNSLAPGSFDNEFYLVDYLED